MNIGDRAKRSQNSCMILLGIETPNENQPRDIAWHTWKYNRLGAFEGVEGNSVGNDSDLFRSRGTPSDKLFSCRAADTRDLLIMGIHPTIESPHPPPAAG